MLELDSYQRRFAVALADGLPREPGLAVYRNTLAAAAVEALAANYPTVRRILGATAFDAFAGDYAAAAPPANPVLAGYGAGFGDWLGRHGIGRTLAYLPSVAQIDWFWTESHIAADADPLDAGELATLPTEDWAAMAVTLHPATRFGYFPLPAPSIWLAHLNATPVEITPNWRAEGVLVTRCDGAVAVRLIDAATHRILSGLRLGEPIAEASGAAVLLYPDADITRAFSEILSSGALSSLKRNGLRP
jgi:hypothetical protein